MVTRRSIWLPVLASLFFVIIPPSVLTHSAPAIAADLQSIKRRGRLVVGVKDKLPPLGFRGTDGQIAGFEIDLARQVAKELLGNSAAIELKPVSNQDRFSSVLNGEVDLVIAQVTLTASRLRILNFSLPYYRDGAAIITRNSAIQTLANLKGQRIAVLNGSSTVEALHKRLPDAELVPVGSYQLAREALETGQAIAMAADASVLAGWVRQDPSYRLLQPLLSVQELAIVLPKGQQYEDLRQEVNQIVNRLFTSGWLDQRANYWGLPRNLTF